MPTEGDQPTGSAAPAAAGQAARSRFSGSPRFAPDRFWQELMALMDRRGVIPIIGSDAVVVEGDLGPRTVAEYVARRAEFELGLDPATPEDQLATPHSVACRYLVEKRGPITEVYGAMKWALDTEFPATATPPPALMKLAAIRAFRLYVSTTFDDLLKRAVDAQRPDAVSSDEPLAYSPDSGADIPTPLDGLRNPLVYYLLGRASPLTDYVVTEEDTLEFVHSLQSENRSPKRLLTELQSHPLLIIGSGYSDWLARFFLRIAKPGRLLVAGKSDYVAGSRSDTGLETFLRYFSAQTKIIDMQALAFIDELADRWAQHEATHGTTAPAPAQARDAEREIFISYANEGPDAEAAARLCDALRTAGLPVWMDKSGGLSGGDQFEQIIEQRIERAPLFVPIISERTRSLDKRFFVKEWKMACKAEESVPFNLPFIVPLRIDETQPNAPWVPDKFRVVHWLDLNHDGLDEVVRQLKSLYRDYQRASSRV